MVSAGMWAPAGVPPDVVEKLNAAVNDGLKSVESRTALSRLGNVPKGGTPGDLTRLMIAEIRKWAPIVQALDLTDK